MGQSVSWGRRLIDRFLIPSSAIFQVLRKQKLAGKLKEGEKQARDHCASVAPHVIFALVHGGSGGADGCCLLQDELHILDLEIFYCVF